MNRLMAKQNSSLNVHESLMILRPKAVPLITSIFRFVFAKVFALLS